MFECKNSCGCKKSCHITLCPQGARGQRGATGATGAKGEAG